MLNGGEVVEALLDQQADDSVGVEDEVSTLRLLVADNPKNPSEPIASPPNKEATHESSAISWGVCGRTVTLSNSTPVETAAVGFWLSDR